MQSYSLDLSICVNNSLRAISALFAGAHFFLMDVIYCHYTFHRVQPANSVLL